MELSNEVWLWLIVGGLLLASEIFTGTFYLLFFGLAGIATSAVAYFEPSLVVQLCVFGILAVFSAYYVNRRGFSSRSQGFANDVAQVIVMSADILANQEGMIQYQGSPWTAINHSNEDLLKGQRACIVKTEGLKLWLKKAED